MAKVKSLVRRLICREILFVSLCVIFGEQKPLYGLGKKAGELKFSQT